jgi:hypothetical protein
VRELHGGSGAALAICVDSELLDVTARFGEYALERKRLISAFLDYQRGFTAAATFNHYGRAIHDLDHNWNDLAHQRVLHRIGQFTQAIEFVASGRAGTSVYDFVIDFNLLGKQVSGQYG